MNVRQNLFQHLCIASVCLLSLPLSSHAQVAVPDAPPVHAKEQMFRDSRFGVRFRVPEGWELQRKDGELSTFHLDARTATPDTQMRSVAAIQFNPYPYSTLSGALFLFQCAEACDGCRMCAAGVGPGLARNGAAGDAADRRDELRARA